MLAPSGLSGLALETGRSVRARFDLSLIASLRSPLAHTLATTLEPVRYLRAGFTNAIAPPRDGRPVANTSAVRDWWLVPAEGVRSLQWCLEPVCCGIDVHQKSLVACVRVIGPEGRVTKHIRNLGTMTTSLGELKTWLADLSVTQVAIKSTGVLWRPV